MKTSELIKLLQDQQQIHGDLPVFYVNWDELSADPVGKITPIFTEGSDSTFPQEWSEYKELNYTFLGLLLKE